LSSSAADGAETDLQPAQRRTGKLHIPAIGVEDVLGNGETETRGAAIVEAVAALTDLGFLGKWGKFSGGQLMAA
jgi:hypothetical protein